MDFVTNSERGVWQTCQRKWFYQYGLRIIFLYMSLDQWIGSIWHAVMDEYWYLMFKQKMDWEEVFPLCWNEINEGIAQYKEAQVKRYMQDYYEGELDVLYSMLGQYSLFVTESPTLLHSEKPLRAPVRTRTGKRSSITRYGGVLDKMSDLGVSMTHKRRLVEITDHKTTNRPVTEWLKEHADLPQMLGYNWLAIENGFDVAFCTYDITWKHRMPSLGDYAVLKNGKALSKRLPKGATANGFRMAIERNGFQLSDHDWYMEKYSKLKLNDIAGNNLYHKFETVTFTRDQLLEFQKEIYVIATEIRRAREKTKEMSRAVQWTGLPSVCNDGCRKMSCKFPRNGSRCMDYKRKCEFYDLCHYNSPESLIDLGLREEYHPEWRGNAKTS